MSDEEVLGDFFAKKDKSKKPKKKKKTKTETVITLSESQAAQVDFRYCFLLIRDNFNCIAYCLIVHCSFLLVMPKSFFIYLG